MAKRKMVQHNLVKNSIAAYFAAMEIHNKPNIPYRYETVTLLLMNAWELVLKAYIKKNMRGEVSVYEKNGHTITLDKSLTHVRDHINAKKANAFTAVAENLWAIESYRNDVAHFYCADILPCIFTLVSRCALNFVDFLRANFNKDIMEEQGLFIMPLGFKLPFNPEEFLSKTSPAYPSTPESKRFIDQIVNTITSLKESGIEDSIVLGFDVYMQTVKKPSNSDILMKITTANEADVKITTVKSVRISNDPSAKSITLSDEDFRAHWKFTHVRIPYPQET
jgi:hypothetical protein